MAKPKIFGPYRRLLPMRRTFGGYSSLWVASDHLLAVSTTGYSDAYRRFYLRDIQGFMLEDSNARLHWGLVFGLTWLAATALSLLGGGDWIAVAIIAVLLGIPFVANLVKGPTCKVYVVTQVQSHRLEAISRRARFARFYDQIAPLIEQAQADLPPRPARGNEVSGAVDGTA